MRYTCLSCSYRTDERVQIKNHAAVLGHFGWQNTDQARPVSPLLMMLAFHIFAVVILARWLSMQMVGVLLITPVVKGMK